MPLTYCRLRILEVVANAQRLHHVMSNFIKFVKRTNRSVQKLPIRLPMMKITT